MATETKLRFGRTLRIVLKRTAEADRLTRLNTNNARKLRQKWPARDGVMRIDNLHGGCPTLFVSARKGDALHYIELWEPEEIALLRDFLNEHFPSPVRRVKR